MKKNMQKNMNQKNIAVVINSSADYYRAIKEGKIKQEQFSDYALTVVQEGTVKISMKNLDSTFLMLVAEAITSCPKVDNVDLWWETNKTPDGKYHRVTTLKRLEGWWKTTKSGCSNKVLPIINMQKAGIVVYADDKSSLLYIDNCFMFKGLRKLLVEAKQKGSKNVIWNAVQIPEIHHKQMSMSASRFDERLAEIPDDVWKIAEQMSLPECATRNMKANKPEGKKANF